MKRQLTTMVLMAALLDEEIRGLDRLPPDALYEVIDGEAKEIPPMGFASNLIANRLMFALARAIGSPRDLVVHEGLFVLPALAFAMIGTVELRRALRR